VSPVLGPSFHRAGPVSSRSVPDVIGTIMQQIGHYCVALFYALSIRWDLNQLGNMYAPLSKTFIASLKPYNLFLRNAKLYGAYFLSGAFGSH
jgi:hypothetical protein